MYTKLYANDKLRHYRLPQSECAITSPNTKHTDTVGYFVAKGPVNKTSPTPPTEQQLPEPL